MEVLVEWTSSNAFAAMGFNRNSAQPEYVISTNEAGE
jgi:hypothetical protein